MKVSYLPIQYDNFNIKISDLKERLSIKSKIQIKYYYFFENLNIEGKSIKFNLDGINIILKKMTQKEMEMIINASNITLMNFSNFVGIIIQIFMKKISILITMLAAAFLGCSKEEDDIGNREENFFKASFLGETYIEEGVSVGASIGGTQDCNNSEMLSAVGVGYFEKSDLFFTAQFIHFDTENDFQTANQNNAKLVNSEIIGNCFSNFDLNIDLLLDGYEVVLINSSKNSHKISKILKVEETKLENNYVIEGEYFGVYENTQDNSTIEISGSYRVPINVMK